MGSFGGEVSGRQKGLRACFPSFPILFIIIVNMKEFEILKIQEASGNKTLFLQKCGGFYRGAGDCAFLLNKVMGYKVRCVERKNGGKVYVAGFPIANINSVIKKLIEYGVVLPDDEKFVPTDCITMKYDGVIEKFEVPVAENKQIVVSVPENIQAVYDAVMGYDVSSTTPMAAINFINDLKVKYGNSK